MTQYLLDTNIISNVTKPLPSASLLQWMSEQADEDLFISTLSLAEIRRGIFQIGESRKKRELEDWFAGPQGPQALFRNRVLSFDESAGLFWARLMAEGTAKGQPRSALDMIVAAIAGANACILVTDNEKDFRNSVAFINPMHPGFA
jgi:toxin FitB